MVIRDCNPWSETQSCRTTNLSKDGMIDIMQVISIKLYKSTIKCTHDQTMHNTMNVDISTQGNLPKTYIKLISRVGCRWKDPHMYPHNNAKFYKPKKDTHICGYFYRGNTKTDCKGYKAY